MRGPKFRFALLVGTLLVAWWVYDVSTTYLFGERGLNFARYQHGVAVVGMAAIGGFLMVWAATGILAQVQRRRTGFESEVTDGYGTTFRMGDSPFPIALSKFLPELIAPPAWPGLSPLEGELMGFLNGYRHWPADLERADESLYLHAMRQWDAMRQLPGAGPLHRAAALAQALSKVYAFREVRTPAPWWNLTTRDQVRFQRRAREQGGMAAFVLSTMPSFALLGDNPDQNRDMRRALLVALRYQHEPQLLPTNAGPLAREVMDYLHRARRKAAELAGQSAHAAPTAAMLQLLKKTLADYAAGLVDDLNPVNPPTADNEAVLLNGGLVLMRQDAVMRRVTSLLPPELRDALNLWDFGGGPDHPAWPHIREALTGLGWMTSTWDDVRNPSGVFVFQLGEQRLERMTVVTPPPATRTKLLELYPTGVFQGLALAQLGADQLKTQFTHHASALTLRLQELG